MSAMFAYLSSLLVFPAVVCSSGQMSVKTVWAYNTSEQLPYVHNAFVTRLPNGSFGAAWQASASKEGAADQKVYFAVSMDTDGLRWPTFESGRIRIVGGNGYRQAWAPTLFTSPDTGALHLFYQQSVTDAGIGGDVLIKTSYDNGETWPANLTRLVLAYDSWGLVNKITLDQVKANPSTGEWMIPFNTLICKDDRPDDSTPFTGLLVSSDRGSTWLPRGHIPMPANITHFQEPTLAFCAGGRAVIFFRSQQKAVYRSVSDDNGTTWSLPEPTSLPNPDSRTNAVNVPGSTDILLAMNPSTKSRSPLAILRSSDCGETWSNVTQIYPGFGAYPIMYLDEINGSATRITTIFTRDSTTDGLGISQTVLA